MDDDFSVDTRNNIQGQSNDAALPIWTQQQQEVSTINATLEEDRRDRILTALKNLDEGIQGDIVLESKKPKFQTAAKMWQLVQEPPLAVVEACSIPDVGLAIPILAGLSKEYSLEFRVKSGGHSFDGASTVQGGVMLSLAKLNSIQLSWDSDNNDGDHFNSSISIRTNENTMAAGYRMSKLGEQPKDTLPKTVTVQPGVKMEDFLATVLDQQGYESVVSSAAGVAFGGFLLGGVYGYTSRIHGLAMDQVTRIKAVLVNGTVVDLYAPNSTSSADNNDLFWGLLGSGGGNFAVAVEYELKVYPSKDMKLGAKLKMPISLLPSFLQKMGEQESKLDGKFIASVQDKFEMSSSPDYQSWNMLEWKSNANDYRHSRLGGGGKSQEEGTATVTLHWMGDSNGGSNDGEVGMDYINKNVLSLIPQSDRQNMVVNYYYFSWSGITRQKEQAETWKTVWAAQAWNGFLMPENNTKAVWQSIYKDFMTIFRYCTFVVPNVELWGGAIGQRSHNETAFRHRQAIYNVGVRLLVPNGTNEEDQVFQDQASLVSAVWPSIAKHLQGAYVNYPMPSLAKEDYPKAYWGGNLERLMQIKEHFDPENYLHHPHSVPNAKARF